MTKQHVSRRVLFCTAALSALLPASATYADEPVQVFKVGAYAIDVTPEKFPVDSADNPAVCHDILHFFARFLANSALRPQGKRALSQSHPWFWNLRSQLRRWARLGVLERASWPQPLRHFAQLSVTTFWSFEREFSPPHVRVATLCPSMNDDNALRQ